MRDRQTTHNLKQRFQFVANLSLFIYKQTVTITST